mgnify:CR=1 FL=1
MSLSAITMRRKPIYLSTFTGRPPDEPSVLGEALNEVFIPLFQQQFQQALQQRDAHHFGHHVFDQFGETGFEMFQQFLSFLPAQQLMGLTVYQGVQVGGDHHDRSCA